MMWNKLPGSGEERKGRSRELEKGGRIRGKDRKA
jgi:hypothetical protein